MKKHILSLVLALALCLGLAVPAVAAGKTVVTTAEELQTAFDKGGEVVLGADIGSETALTISSSTRLDLNGHKLSVIVSRLFGAGIVIKVGQTLTVLDSKYQKGAANDGKLYVNGSFGTGIQTSGATLIVNSGVIEAIGNSGTGIGGSAQSGYYDGGTVTINGGEVTATGGTPGTYSGAGIGGIGAVVGANGSGGTITINGGSVTATGGTYAAGIGGGGNAGNNARNSGGTITINGGTVHARGSYSRHHHSPDIGAGNGAGEDNSTVLKINGGTVELHCAGIDAKKLTLKSCTITGDGAGDYKGSYDVSGNKITVQGASGWAQESVAAAIARNLVPLSLQSSYTQPATRAEFCALGVAFYETITGTEITERKTFSDTDDVTVQKMGALGVVSGVGGDRFDPNGTLTREQAATMLSRLAEAVGTPLPQSVVSFGDTLPGPKVRWARCRPPASWAVWTTISSAPPLPIRGNSPLSPYPDYLMQ